MIDSKENYKFDVGVKELNKMHDNSAYSQVWHFNCPITLSNYKHDTYRNFRSFTRTADYPHRPIIAYGEKKSHQITRTGG